jgi:23S rRNA pseudouridine955/2504/2580 synthase
MPQVQVSRESAGQRLDRFLRKLLPGMPSSHIFKLLRTRKVRVNGKRARAELTLAAGDVVLLHMEESRFAEDTRVAGREPVRARTDRLDFGVVFEDRHLLVVSKPPFLAVHPGAGHDSGSLIDQIHAYLDVPERPGVFRPALAHRLDRDTSGLVLVGKELETLRTLSDMFQAGSISKKYLALARGRPRPPKGLWELAVERKDLPGSQRQEPRGRPDAPGRTAYRVALTRELAGPGEEPVELSLLVLKLLTGKTHQIRSHLLQAGHPLAGDPRYGDRALNRRLKARFDLRRQFLHAYRLELTHPVTGGKLSLVDPYPADLEPLVRALRLGVPAY